MGPEVLQQGGPSGGRFDSGCEGLRLGSRGKLHNICLRGSVAPLRGVVSLFGKASLLPTSGRFYGGALPIVSGGEVEVFRPREERFINLRLLLEGQPPHPPTYICASCGYGAASGR